MITFLIAAYRAFPFRPHCDSARGVHALPCRLTRMADSWCPAKDA
jgi:hypothetical protein